MVNVRVSAASAAKERATKPQAIADQRLGRGLMVSP
jgi:hypothetical protein